MYLHIHLTILTMSSPSAHTVYPFYQCRDFTTWPNPILLKDAEEHLRSLKELKTRDDDVLLCTPVKSGTHWVHEILSMLLTQTTEYNSTGDIMKVQLEYVEPESIESIKSPRLLHSHLPLTFHPVHQRKIVYVNRNPKDRHVSFFNFLREKCGVPENWTWNYYFNEHVLKDNFLTGWFNYTKVMTKAAQDNSLNIIQILYEDLLMDPKREILRLAQFLKVPYTDKFIDEVVVACKFDNLKKHKIDAGKPFSKGGKSTLFRKGKIGDWKNWFTVSQNDQFDEIYKREMKNVEVEFTFENNKQDE